jgi:tetratricopeptide (TPR) repeat protein
MRHLISWQLSLLLLAATAALAQVPNSIENGRSSAIPPAEKTIPPDASQEPTTQSTITPGLTVTGSAPQAESTLPKLAPDKFTECYGKYATNLTGSGAPDYIAAETCEFELARDERIVIDKCTNRDDKSAPAVAIQACTELLDRKLLEGHDRFYPYVNRAKAYFVQGDKRRALDDYNMAVQVAPKSPQPYYYRGVFYTFQTDGAAALRDFDTALSIDPKLVLALRQRAIIYLTERNLSGALADYSEAVRLQPKTAALWSERGHVRLLQRDYESAVKDEAEAIRLDPKFAQAYFLRGAAFGDLGNSSNAVSDIQAAVELNPLMAHYVSINGKTASIELPPL